MGIKNKDVMQMIVDKTKEMENHLNAVEKEVQKSDEQFNKAIIAVSTGKLMKLYQDVAYLLGVNDGHPKYEGM